jgi:RND superfamily putative drug exporter
MFEFFGRFGQKYRYYILAVWVALTIFFVIQAPTLSQVGVTDQSQFLPTQTESVYARNLIAAKFGSSSNTSASGLIVVYNANGLTDINNKDGRNIRNWLISDEGPGYVSQVVSVYDSEALRATLVSADNTTMMMNVGFTTTSLDDLKPTIQAIREQFKTYPETTFYFTGSVGFLHDLFESVQRTIDKTTIVTIILVIVLLLIIFRSPVAALVPLFTIGMSFLITRGVIGYLAQAGISFSTVTDAYMVVTIFGVGTDYCLFIISRFREELAHEKISDSIIVTMKRIAPVILASAVTVIIAFLCLGVSRFEMTKTSGIALAIGIAITLLVGLTLIPALMSISGRYMFWPTKTKAAPKPKTNARKGFVSWEKVGNLISKHPLWVAIPIIALLVLPYIGIHQLTLSANILNQLSPDEESTQGLNVIREHFSMGDLSPLVLVIQSKGRDLLDERSLLSISEVAQSMTTTKDISRVDYPSITGTQLISTATQVKILAGMVTTPNFDFTKLKTLESLSGSLQAMAIRYPGVLQSNYFVATGATLMEVSSITSQLSTAPMAELPGLIGQLQASLNNLGDALTALGNEFIFNGSGPFVDSLKATYFSNDGTVAKMNLVLSIDPFSNQADAAIPEVRNAVASAMNSANLLNADAYVGGDTAVYADMTTTSNSDLTIVIIVTSMGILAVIVILLRSLIAALYMVGTVLLNYGATIGIISWVFSTLFGYEAIINMLPVFLFVMLAAVGADYNIFLVSRIREESEKRSLKEAVHHSVSHTGNVITSCGIILAGTFATLASSSFPMVLEIGVAIAIGVLIDTFVVRALLVPSLAVICRRWGWWPSKLFRTVKDN